MSEIFAAIIKRPRNTNPHGLMLSRPFRSEIPLGSEVGSGTDRKLSEGRVGKRNRQGSSSDPIHLHQQKAAQNGRIRTPDLLITNCPRHRNPTISKPFQPFLLQNQQLVPAARSTVSTPSFPPVGQLVGQAASRAESGLDDSDNSPNKERNRRFEGYIVTQKGIKVKLSIFWTQ